MNKQKFFYLSIILILADQITKVWVKGFTLFGVTHQGMMLGESVNVIGDFLKFSYVENPGMAFGIQFGAGKIFLSLFSVVAAGGLAWYLYKLRKFSVWVQLGVSLLLAGAIGNLVDRVFYGVLYGSAPLFYGQVVDFIDVEFFDMDLFGQHLTRFWVFNIADSCVSCGIVLLMIVNTKIPTFAELKAGMLLPQTPPEPEIATEDTLAGQESTDETETHEDSIQPDAAENATDAATEITDTNVTETEPSDNNSTSRNSSEKTT